MVSILAGKGFQGAMLHEPRHACTHACLLGACMPLGFLGACVFVWCV